MKINTYVENKSHTVYVSFSFKGKQIYVSTGLTSEAKFKGTEIPGSSAKKHRLRQICNDVEDFINLNPRLNVPDMKKHIREIISGREERLPLLVDYIREVEKTKLKPGTKSFYEVTAKRIEIFDSDIHLNEVTPAWLDSFVISQRKNGRMVNGIAIDLRNIRAVFNHAIDNEVTEHYPFRRYKIKQEETRKRNLSEEQVRIIKHTGNRYTDMFMLMLYLRGINFRDLYEARRSQIKDGRLDYRRNKTGRLFSVKIEPEAQLIIDKYKGRVYLLKFIETCNTATFLSRMNKALKKAVAGISTYWSRHTVASIAAEIDIPLDIIARLLGHADASHSTTMIYINFDEKKSDDANRKIIDYINRI